MTKKSRLDMMLVKLASVGWRMAGERSRDRACSCYGITELKSSRISHCTINAKSAKNIIRFLLEIHFGYSRSLQTINALQKMWSNESATVILPENVFSAIKCVINPIKTDDRFDTSGLGDKQAKAIIQGAIDDLYVSCVAFWTTIDPLSETFSIDA